MLFDKRSGYRSRSDMEIFTSPAENNQGFSAGPSAVTINEGKQVSQSDVLTDGTGNEDLDEIINIAGYDYDLKQDIFISNIDPWQRKMGYCRFFDEAAAPMGMIIDSEPVHFEYLGKKWLIGFWKGQYDLVSGGEIGIYRSILPFNIPGISSGIYYSAISEEDFLPMSYTLKKNGNPIFTRQGTHWWLTGFKLGEFSNPEELSMDISITLKDPDMLEAFLAGLRNAGYADDEFGIEGTTVNFTFAAPHSHQPLTRTKLSDKIIQRKNKLLCDAYEKITGPYPTVPEKVKALEEKSPEIYRRFIEIGSTKQSMKNWIAGIIFAIMVLYYLTKNREENLDTEETLPVAG